jgi:conjugative transfer signal peptidase TraF
MPSVAGFFGIRLNLTPSVPIGLYRISASPEANYAEFCPPEPFGRISMERGYRQATYFGCPDGGKPLLKPIVAREGDIVTLSAEGVSINGKKISNSAAMTIDALGRSVQSAPLGIYRVEQGSVWVISPYHSTSLDSRYFGPIPISRITHRLTPLWTASRR